MPNKRNKTYGLLLMSMLIAFLALFAFNLKPQDKAEIIYQRTPEMGDQIIIKVKENLTAEQAKDRFTINPTIEGELQWIAKYRELHFIPHKGFLKGQQYEITFSQKGQSLLSALLQGKAQKTFHAKELPAPRLVRLPDEETIYYITESGLKRAMPSREVYLSYPSSKTMEVETIDRQTLNLYPDNTLIHLDGDARVYKLENGRKRWIKNPQTFNAMVLSWDIIAPVNKTELAAYPDGDPIDFTNLPHPAAKKGKFIEVNLTEMEVKLFENARLSAAYPVAGKGNPITSPTREGLFSIKTKEANHFSTLSRVWMPWSMRYSGGYFIHEWPYWPRGAKIKTKYSAGCIRLFQGDAQEVYDWVEINTPVLIH